MATGMSTSFIQSVLNVLRGTSFTGVTTLTVGLHTGDPGAAGTTAGSANTTKNTLTLAAPSGGSAAQSALPAWTMTATETISHISLWNGATFLWSGALSSSVPVISGSTLTISGLTVGLSPIAA